MATCNWIVWCRSQFYHIEDWVKAMHGVWKFKAVCNPGDLFLHLVRAQPTVGKLLQWSGSASPCLNLTTMVFGSEYPELDIRSWKSSR